MQRFIGLVTVEGIEESKHEATFCGFAAELAEIEDAAFGHAGDGFPDQGTRILRKSEIAAGATKDHKLLVAPKCGWRLTIGFQRQPPPNSKWIRNDQPGPAGKQALYRCTSSIGFTTACIADKGQPII